MTTRAQRIAAAEETWGNGAPPKPLPEQLATARAALTSCQNDRGRLEARVAVLEAENKALKAALAISNRAGLELAGQLSEVARP